MIINGIQYMRPSGRLSPFTTEIPDDLKEKWKQIQDCGLRLAGELLLTDDVSTTLENDEGDFGHKYTCLTHANLLIFREDRRSL